jgi:hypothetical protein
MGWLAGRSEPTGVRAERLIELAEMINRLTLVLRVDLSLAAARGSPPAVLAHKDWKVRREGIA